MTTTVEPIVKSITVRVPQERAFEVFTAGMDRWWNREYGIGENPLETVVLEPREGGRWFERDAQGTECDWGRVLAWEPPSRVLLAWQISAQWAHDPGLETELEITFTPLDDASTEVRLEHRNLERYGDAAAEMRAQLDDASTQVRLEHRNLERYGDAADQMRAQLDDPSGWSGLLERMAEVAPAAA